MSLAVEYDFAARHAFESIPWPLSQDVDAAVQRFARERAPSLASGLYQFRAAGYVVSVRLDRASGTVLVLYLYPRR